MLFFYLFAKSNLENLIEKDEELKWPYQKDLSGSSLFTRESDWVRPNMKQYNKCMSCGPNDE